MALRLIPLLVLLSATSASVAGAPPVLHPSPFSPPPTEAAAAPAAPAGSHEFTGVIITGKTILINLTDAQAKRSFWIPLGKSEEGIEVLDYDRKNDAATVRIRGEQRRLPMKQPTVIGTSGITVATVPVAPTVPLPPPSSPAEAEREARMLVSDLLEIGMQQRKAYEEAQRKASAESARRGAVGSPLPVNATPKPPGS
ncbi:MAG TPA: hypothetical protein PKX00_04660 [Opitutaceae bacterium]|nr:hypothetical protein [Opitutaceae bacterium]